MELREQIALAIYIVIPLIGIPWLFYKILTLDKNEADRSGQAHSSDH